MYRCGYNRDGCTPLLDATQMDVTPPPGQTDACENITFPQLRLRAVIMSVEFFFEMNKNGINENWESEASLGVTFCHEIFLFSHSKASDTNVGIITNVMCLLMPPFNPC